MKRVFTGLAATIFASTVATIACAQDLVITNASLHIGDGTGTVENADIIIEKGRIKHIGSDLKLPAEVQTIDANHQPVTPAFFAGATRSGLVEVSAVSESADSDYEALYTDLMHPEFDVRAAYNPYSSVIPVTRIEGFSYALLTATSGDRSISGQGGLVRFDGGYESFEGKPVLFVELSGYSADNVGGSRAAHWMLLGQAFDELERGAELELLSYQGRNALAEIKDKGVIVFNVNRATDIMQVIKFAKTREVQAVIHGGREAWIVADALAKAGIPVMLNALDNLPANFDSLGSRLDNAALLNAAGVTVMFSSGETHNARKVRQLAGNAVANGMPMEAAIQAMTTTPASVFGGRHRSARKGAIADLVLWSGDPLDVSSVAQQVIINGKPDPMISRQTLLRDRYMDELTLPRAYSRPE